jgi:mono/diheme cytochrome c family protein
MLKHCQLTLLATVLSLSATAALAADVPKAGSAPAGQETFNTICMQCHSIQPDQVRFGPSLYGELKKPHPRKTDAEVRQILKEGKGKMPPLGGKLSDQDIANLVAYLHTL